MDLFLQADSANARKSSKKQSHTCFNITYEITETRQETTIKQLPTLKETAYKGRLWY